MWTWVAGPFEGRGKRWAAGSGCAGGAGPGQAVATHGLSPVAGHRGVRGAFQNAAGRTRPEVDAFCGRTAPCSHRLPRAVTLPRTPSLAARQPAALGSNVLCRYASHTSLVSCFTLLLSESDSPSLDLADSTRSLVVVAGAPGFCRLRAPLPRGSTALPNFQCSARAQGVTAGRGWCSPVCNKGQGLTCVSPRGRAQGRDRRGGCPLCRAPHGCHGGRLPSAVCWFVQLEQAGGRLAVGPVPAWVTR